MIKRRRVHTDARKKQLVAKAIRTGNIQEVAHSAKIAHSMLRHWCRDPRFGGKPDAFRQKPKAPTEKRPMSLAQTRALPQERVPHYRKARSLVATQFSCPWCGSPIKTGAGRDEFYGNTNRDASPGEDAGEASS